MFVLTGRMLAVEGSSVVADVRGLLARRPGLGAPFLVGMAALLGFPPFSVFFSEVGIFVALWQQGMGWVAAVGLVLLLVVFAGLTRLTAAMLFGAPQEPVRHADRSWHGPSLPLLIALGVTAVVAFLAGPLSDVLVRSAELLVGGA